VAYNNKLFELGRDAQTRLRDFQLSNIKINRNKSCVMDMDKEIRPMSRGRSSCGNRDSLNSTTRTTGSGMNQTGPKHEVNVLRIEDDDNNNANDIDNDEGTLIETIMPITRQLSISQLRKMAQEQEDKEDLNVSEPRNRQSESERQDKLSRGPLNSTPFGKSEGNNKENVGNPNLPRKNKLPPMLPPTKKKGRLEPLKESLKSGKQNQSETEDGDDVFKGGDAFEMSFSDT